MTDPQDNSWPESDSRDCVNIVIDCVPAPKPWTLHPEVLKVLLAEREENARWEAELKRQQAEDQANEGPKDAPK